MGRIIVLVWVASMMTVMTAASFASPAFADKPCVPAGCAEDFAFGECVSFLAATEGVLPIGGGEFSSKPGEYARAQSPPIQGAEIKVGCPKDTSPPPPP